MGPQIGNASKSWFHKTRFLWSVTPKKSKRPQSRLSVTIPQTIQDGVVEGRLQYRNRQNFEPVGAHFLGPTFAFVDQQAAEVTWETLREVADFRSRGKKTELWILMSQ